MQSRSVAWVLVAVLTVVADLNAQAVNPLPRRTRQVEAVIPLPPAPPSGMPVPPSATPPPIDVTGAVPVAYIMESEPRQVALAGGANAVVAPGNAEGSGGGTVGISVWKPNVSYLQGMFSFADASVYGVDQGAGEVATAILDPSLKGLGARFEGNRMWGVGDSFRVGGGLIAGVTRSDWKRGEDGEPGAMTAVGFVMYATPSFQVATPEYKFQNSRYAFGADLGYGVRTLTNDLGEDDAFRRSVLGTDQKTFRGPEVTLFLRLDNIIPFVRVTHFETDTAIRGLSGTQVLLGVKTLASMLQADF